MPSTARFGRVRFTWIVPPSAMGREVKRLADQMEPVLLAQMNALSQSLVQYMRQNAPWSDRTGNARARLNSNSNVTAKGTVTLSAFHGVPYGGFLETGTRYMSPRPILRPALEAHYAKARQIMNDIAGSG